MSTELKRMVAIDSAARRRSEKRATEPSFSDSQLAVIMGVASSLEPEKRTALMERLIAFLKLQGIGRVTDRELDVGLRVALQNLVHGSPA